MIRRVLAVAMCAALIAVSASTLTWLIDIDAWGRAAAVGLGVAAAVLVAGRTLTSWRVWPSLAAAAAGLVAVVRVEVSDQLGWADLVDPAIIPVLRERFELGVETLRTSAPPAPAVPGLAFGVGTLIVLAFVCTEALAVATESPVLAGVAALCLWLPVILIGVPVPPLRILAAVAVFVGLLAVCARANPPPVQASTIPLTVAMVAATVLVVSVAAPAALAIPAPEWLGTLSRTGVNARLDLGMDLREDLVRGSNAPVLEYSGIAPAALGPVHSYTLTDFDGTRWRRNDPQQDFTPTTTLYATDSLPGSDLTPSAPVTFTIDNLGQDRLFLPDGPRLSASPVPYDAVRDEAASATTGAVSYTLTPLARPSHPDYWRAQSAQVFTDENLALPDSAHMDQIRALTESVTTGERTAYDKAVAIERFLRSDPHFVYTTSLPPSATTDPVYDFLNDGRGYCVQFATAMVIMSRAAGIPARMAVGYLPGESTDAAGEPGGVVSVHDAHTWPQLFFGRAGWLRFEPTPAVRAPLGSVAAVPTDSQPGQEEVPPSQSATLEPSSQAPTTAPVSASPGAAAEAGDAGGLAWWPWVAGALVAAGAAALAWRRRSSAAPAPAPTPTVEDLWDRARELLGPYGLAPNPALTPLQVRARAATLAPHLSPHRRHGSSAAPTWEQSLAPLDALTAAVIAARYRPGGHAQAVPAARWTEELAANLAEWEPMFPTHEAGAGTAKPATTRGAGAGR